MACKLGGLFSLDEDFDDEDLLGPDWKACSAPGPAREAQTGPSCSLRAPSIAHREQEQMCHRPPGEKRAGTGSRGDMHSAAQTVALVFRQISSSSSTPPVLPPLSTANISDDFDDWDVDLADLDECDNQTRQSSKPPAPVAGKTLRPSTYVTSQTPTNQSLRELAAASKTSSYCTYNTPRQSLSATHLHSQNPCPSFLPARPQTPAVCLNATSPASGSFSRTPSQYLQIQKPRVAPHASPQTGSLFNTVSPAPPPSASSPALSPHPLHTPFLTNRLVQLVSASSKLPKKRPRSEAQQPKTRRFPGPAGLLPQQPQSQNLDEIVVSVPHAPAHGAVARRPSQCSSSQSEEDEFSGRAWAAMKAEMGLDERNPSCFLHTYSVIMVLRKAALKQLPRNKVPNMAVLLKSIIHTKADAKAVFRDPTGEIQGTVHRCLLEERSEEFKAGAVLLLKQVGVFSPSHRNHYLNVTLNNLLRIYSPDGVSLSTKLHAFVLESTMASPTHSPDVRREPMSRMQLEFDEEDGVGKEAGANTEEGRVPGVQLPTQENSSLNSSRGLGESFGNPAMQDADWDGDDDLDELLGNIPEDTYSF